MSGLSGCADANAAIESAERSACNAIKQSAGSPSQRPVTLTRWRARRKRAQHAAVCQLPAFEAADRGVIIATCTRRCVDFLTERNEGKDAAVGQAGPAHGAARRARVYERAARRSQRRAVARSIPA